MKYKRGTKYKIYRDELIYRDLGESMIKLGKKLYLDQGETPLKDPPMFERAMLKYP